MKKEVKILGAGISGLTAAINLAKAGFKVIIYEKNKDCGTRFNGDFQGIENWSKEKDALKEIREMNIKTNFKFWISKKIDILDYKDNKSKFSSKRSLFYLVRRGCMPESLDSSLKKQAIDSGVRIIFNSKAKEEDVDIIATGPSRIFAIAKGMSFETKHKSVHMMQLNDEDSFKGYSYAFIAGGHGSIATVLFGKYPDANKEFNEVKEHFLKHHKIKIKNSREWSGFGAFSLSGPYIRNGKLIIGEAAGLQDFLWGFGMRSSMISGYLAAKSIIENKSYKKLIKENFGNYLKNALVNRFLWERLGNTGYKDFLGIAKAYGDPYTFLNKTYSYTFLKRVIYPIAYLKLKNRLK
jgi:flavin-dependent dehydrogenase